MKIVIAGAGEVGTHLAKMLSQENQDIILMDPNEERLNISRNNMEVLPMVGNPTSLRDLEEAGIRKADLFDTAADTAHHDDHGDGHEDQAVDDGLAGVADEAAEHDVAQRAVTARSSGDGVSAEAGQLLFCLLYGCRHSEAES